MNGDEFLDNKKFDLGNTTSRAFALIDNELVRTYYFDDGGSLEIAHPKALHVSESGHYVVDSNNLCYFIPFESFLYLTWLPRPGEPHFVC